MSGRREERSHLRSRRIKNNDWEDYSLFQEKKTPGSRNSEKVERRIETSKLKMSDKKAEEYYSLMKTREEKMTRLLLLMDKIQTEWHPFVKKIAEDPSIPAPLLPLVDPLCFEWRDRNGSQLCQASFDCITGRIRIGPSHDLVTSEEAYRAVRAVFVPAKAK